MFLAVAYDIHEDSNRRRVRKTLRRYGAWRQFSLFELEIDPVDRVELEEELAAHLDADDGDRVRIYRICESCRSEVTDLGHEPPETQSNVI